MDSKHVESHGEYCKIDGGRVKLSSSFKELVSVIGFDEAVLFVRMYGGKFK